MKKLKLITFIIGTILVLLNIALLINLKLSPDLDKFTENFILLSLGVKILVSYIAAVILVYLGIFLYKKFKK